MLNKERLERKRIEHELSKLQVKYKLRNTEELTEQHTNAARTHKESESIENAYVGGPKAEQHANAARTHKESESIENTSVGPKWISVGDIRITL